MFDIENPSPPRLPPIRQLIDQDWAPRYERPFSSSPPSLLDFRTPPPLNNEHTSSVPMSEHRPRDGPTSSTIDMGVAYHPSIVLAGEHDTPSSNHLPTAA